MKHVYLVHFYSDGFTKINYTFISAEDSDEAYAKAAQRFGSNNVSSVKFYK